MNLYKIINDDGVDYAFIGENRSWIGQIVEGLPNPNLYFSAITIKKPFDLIGTYTASAENFEEIAS